MGFAGRVFLAVMLMAPIASAGCKKDGVVHDVKVGVPPNAEIVKKTFDRLNAKDDAAEMVRALQAAKDKARVEIFNSVIDPNDEAVLVQNNFKLSGIFVHVVPGRNEVPNKENTLYPAIRKWVLHSRENSHLEDNIMRLFKVHYEEASLRNLELTRNVARAITEISNQE